MEIKDCFFTKKNHHLKDRLDVYRISSLLWQADARESADVIYRI